MSESRLRVVATVVAVVIGLLLAYYVWLLIEPPPGLENNGDPVLFTRYYYIVDWRGAAAMLGCGALVALMFWWLLWGAWRKQGEEPPVGDA